MRRRWLLMLGWALVLAAVSVLPAGAGAAPTQPPAHFRAGVEWVYRHTATSDGQTESGTATMVYRGQATYRGASYHLIEYSLTLAPGGSERQFLVWDRGFFRQAAAVITEGSDTLEIVFDRPIALGGVAEVRRGSAQIYVNGALQGSAPWSTSVEDKGGVRITVPAGSFQTRRWGGTYTLGQLRQVFTVYMVGPHEVRADIDVYTGDTLTKKDRLELMRGPVSER